MFEDIADHVIRVLNNQVVEFRDDRGKPLRILVKDMSWDNDRQQLDKTLSEISRRKATPPEPYEVLEALFFVKVTVLLCQSHAFSIDDVNLFLEAIKPKASGGIRVTPHF